MAMFPGFPEEVSEKIDMPDIAELLSYPMFRVAEAETVYKQGSDFQRMLLSKVPLKNNTKHVTVYSSVHLLYQGVRPITTGASSGKFKEWHVDGLENSPMDHINPQERVHLLLGHTTFPTVFNAEPIEIMNAEYMDILTFNRYITTNGDALGIKDRVIENGKIYTFSNHIHRAQDPTRMEFRFSFRVRETNRPDVSPVHLQSPEKNHFFDGKKRIWTSNIERKDGKVTIDYSDIFRP